MAGGIWGESNTRNFLAWADNCQRQAMAARGLHLNTSVNFSNISDPRAIDAKEKLLTLIQGKKEISVAAIYNAMAPELCANPTTKTLLMQLYYENNLRIESVAKNGTETNFVLIFESRRRAEPKVTQVASKTIVKNQSNIEDLIDDNWRSRGRKLEFDKKEKVEQEFNTSLKKEKPKEIIPTNEKPVQDVRDFLKANNVNTGATPPPPRERRPRDIPPPPIPEPVPVRMPEVELKLPEIDLAPIPEVTFQKMEPVSTPKMEFQNDLEFAGLSCFELYLLEMYFIDAAANESDRNKKTYFKTNASLCKTKGDILYLEENNKSGFVKFILGILAILIVTIPILMAYLKNKERKEAKTEYLRIRKKLAFEQVKNNFKNKYPRVVHD
jgi:hypothetical protein